MQVNMSVYTASESVIDTNQRDMKTSIVNKTDNTQQTN